MRRQKGAVAVEFALVATLAIGLLFSLIEIGHAMFLWNSAADATRRGVRMASIVGIAETTLVKQDMRALMPGLSDEQITVEYSADGLFSGQSCVRGNCRFVRVRLSYTFKPLVLFFLPATIPMPAFAATSPVEALGNR